jgi:hypothetical protein
LRQFPEQLGSIASVIGNDKSASIRQLHWHRRLDVKRPYRRCTGSHDPEVVMIEAVVPINAD